MIRHMGISRLRDSYGRGADDLRISITDRCNFRCIYCMPAEGLKWLAREDLLRFEELARLARLFVERYGVRDVRITVGGARARRNDPYHRRRAARACQGRGAGRDDQRNRPDT